MGATTSAQINPYRIRATFGMTLDEALDSMDAQLFLLYGCKLTQIVEAVQDDGIDTGAKKICYYIQDGDYRWDLLWGWVTRQRRPIFMCWITPTLERDLFFPSEHIARWRLFSNEQSSTS